MIRKIKIKFIVIAMISVFAVISLMLGVIHSQQGSEPPRGKRRQPSPVKLKALLARS